VAIGVDVGVGVAIGVDVGVGVVGTATPTIGPIGVRASAFGSASEGVCPLAQVKGLARLAGLQSNALAIGAACDRHSLAVSCILTVALYLVAVWLLPKLGINF
jgi:hypothetical protein